VQRCIKLPSRLVSSCGAVGVVAVLVGACVRAMVGASSSPLAVTMNPRGTDVQGFDCTGSHSTVRSGGWLHSSRAVAATGEL
jgi:hypothetical protein